MTVPQTPLAPRRSTAALCTACLAALAALAACSRNSPDRMEGTGTLELVEVDVAPTTTARVERVLAEEGARVRVGDTLAILSQPALPSQLAQQGAREQEAAARLRELEHGSLPEDIRRARDDLAAADADAVRTSRDLARAEPLASHDVISKQQLDAARAAAQISVSRRDAARATLERVQRGARSEQIDAARAQVAAMQAASGAVRATARDLVLVSPIAGVITSRNVEAGEVLNAGQSAMTVGDTRRPWVRVFVGQAVLPLLRVGQTVAGVLDDYPGKPYAGRIVAISAQAEFTPRVALTEKERADMLFGVKVEFNDAREELKAGMPITVRLRSTDAGRTGNTPAAVQVRRDSSRTR